MRPLTINRDDDRGAVLVWVALMLTVMLGIGALVIDVGALYAERRQLQNGADAAALAVAMDCAEGNCLTEIATAEDYADSNANDGAAMVDEVCGSGPGLADTVCGTPPAVAAGATGWVQVTTSTHNPASSKPEEVDFVLAPVLDALNDGSSVKASAAAAWGIPSEAETLFPLAIGLCEFTTRYGGGLDGLDNPGESLHIEIHEKVVDDAGCLFNTSSGSNFPGGFGWVDHEDCSAAATADLTPTNFTDDPDRNSDGIRDVWLESDAGNGKSCAPTLDTNLLMPIYDIDAFTAPWPTGMPSGIPLKGYHIVGFAGFHVTGYDLIHGGIAGTVSKKECTRSCLEGYFTHVTTIAGAAGGNPGFSYGASAVYMIG